MLEAEDYQRAASELHNWVKENEDILQLAGQLRQIESAVEALQTEANELIAEGDL